MSTRSRIAIKHPDGNIESIYCHWDGYPSGVGKILLENYSDTSKINVLMKLGDLSSLDANPFPSSDSNHSWENPEMNVSVAYSRDRGDIDTESETHSTFEELCEYCREGYVNYLYIWEDFCWYYCNPRDEVLRSLKEDVVNK